MNVYSVKKNDSSCYFQCHCGKLCKGIRVIRAHQRFCTVSDVSELRQLFNEEIITNGEYFNDEILERLLLYRKLSFRHGG